MMAEKMGLYIDGKWIMKETTYPLYSPYSGEFIAEISVADEEDVQRAILGAHQAFLDFKERSAYERANILYAVVELIKEKKEESQISVFSSP